MDVDKTSAVRFFDQEFSLNGLGIPETDEQAVGELRAVHQVVSSEDPRTRANPDERIKAIFSRETQSRYPEIVRDLVSEGTRMYQIRKDHFFEELLIETISRTYADFVRRGMNTYKSFLSCFRFSLENCPPEILWAMMPLPQEQIRLLAAAFQKAGPLLPDSEERRLSLCKNAMRLTESGIYYTSGCIDLLNTRKTVDFLGWERLSVLFETIVENPERCPRMIFLLWDTSLPLPGDDWSAEAYNRLLRLPGQDFSIQIKEAQEAFSASIDEATRICPALELFAPSPYAWTLFRSCLSSVGISIAECGPKMGENFSKLPLKEMENFNNYLQRSFAHSGLSVQRLEEELASWLFLLGIPPTQ